MKKHTIIQIERSLEQKAERRHRKHMPKMRVSGKSVFAIQQSMRKPARHKRTS